MKQKFSIVLLRPEIPHNTGAIGRLAVGLGVSLNLVKPLGFALDDRSIAVSISAYECYRQLSAK